MLVGPSGVGKTETALALSDLLYGGEHNLITINMSEFQEAHTISTLKGSPPGYFPTFRAYCLRRLPKTQSLTAYASRLVRVVPVLSRLTPVWISPAAAESRLFSQASMHRVALDSSIIGTFPNISIRLCLSHTEWCTRFLSQRSHPSHDGFRAPFTNTFLN
jgi:AAA domain (Cdc48 subfamily)